MQLYLTNFILLLQGMKLTPTSSSIAASDTSSIPFESTGLSISLPFAYCLIIVSEGGGAVWVLLKKLNPCNYILIKISEYEPPIRTHPIRLTKIPKSEFGTFFPRKTELLQREDHRGRD